MAHKIFVGIGSNIDREKNIKSCITILKDIYGDILISPVYETEAMGFNGPNFYNLVSCFETKESVYDLKSVLNEIENSHGRHASETKFSSRTLDIDILYYDNLILSDDKIQIPRKEICEYDFVLKPLVDLVPDFIHPIQNISHLEIMNNIKVKKQIISTIDMDL
jgi:2-amino-4-hydroxy-6-hydroxymethyldihydropteridine diphosphokinase